MFALDSEMIITLIRITNRIHDTTLLIPFLPTILLNIMLISTSDNLDSLLVPCSDNFQNVCSYDDGERLDLSRLCLAS